MDGNETVVVVRVRGSAGTIIGNDRFCKQGQTDQDAPQTKYAADRWGVHRVWKAPLPDAEVSNEQWEMLERIRVAAGQTS